MKSLFILLLIINSTNRDISGVYSILNNDIYGSSVLKLNKDGSFTFNSAYHACKDRGLSGTWTTNGKRLVFENDLEFTKGFLLKQDSIFYKEMKELTPEINEEFLDHILPSLGYIDLNQGNWKIKKSGIKLRQNIECICWNKKGIYHKYETKK